MRKFIYILGIGAFVSCSDEIVEAPKYLNGTEKTPITVVTNIKSIDNVTRAVDDKFEENDVLQAYIKHVTVQDANADQLVWSADVTGTGVGPVLAKFTISSLKDNYLSEADNYTNHETSSTLKVTDPEGLYWDDFSNSNSADTDLRTEGHALMVYYGYSYNGTTVAESDFTAATGVLKWSVADNQTGGFKASDLLFAGQQEPVAYKHSTSSAIGGDHGVLEIPYSHAMSKVTVKVVCDKGFASDATKNFGSAAITLLNMGTKTTVTAPTLDVTKGTTPQNITMQKLVPEAKTCSFSALIAPTVLKDGQHFATLTGFDGNKYEVVLTDAILTPATNPANPWSTKLADPDATSVTPTTGADYKNKESGDGKGGLTLPGVHYVLTVTINKQEIAIKATIAPWVDVEAEGVGEIQFANDITDKTGTMATELQAGGFDIYQKGTASDAAYSKVTTYTYDGDPANWTRNNEIYWPNATDKFYFRALSPKETNAASLSNGNDYLWGTTDAYTWGSEDVAKGYPVAPRTGDVPLTFEHAMAKVTVNLIDYNKDSSNSEAKLDLENATIQFLNLATGGSIELQEGNISPSAITEGQKTFSEDGGRKGFYAAKENGSETNYDANFTLKDYVVIPQDLNDESASTFPAMIVVTLANGTTYKAKLRNCKDSSTNTNVVKWERGKHYIYDITLSKDQVTFRAEIKNWDPVTATGTITPEW